MPVTVQVVDHPADPWDGAKAATPDKLLEAVDKTLYAKSKRVLRSSFSETQLGQDHISASSNGLVWAAIYAYSGHHHLTIRPEDVWFAILTQLSFYINAHAEELRSFFVAHQGQKELKLVVDGSVWDYDFGDLAEQMTHLMAKDINDPELRTWVVPSFTTTTDTDVAVAAILFMGAMQKYYSYGMFSRCGIPSVTVLGEVSDWEDILGRLDKLAQLGEEPAEFAEILRPILKNIIVTMTDPTDPGVARFWNSIADLKARSGSSRYTGWIAAFCFWGENGKRKMRRPTPAAEYRPQSPRYDPRNRAASAPPPKPPHDLASYPSIESSDIPKGFASLPVQVDEFKCRFVAGSMGILAAAAGEERGRAAAERTAIQPASGWLLLERDPADDVEARQEGIKALDAETRDLEVQSEEPERPGDMESLRQATRAWQRRLGLKAIA